ncbi:DEAD/DEAH box helicase [Mycobacterium sp. TNTM28]|uniref:DEAD/DEAH box helicase n=1 Tax=[Mycobacterium] fortunisiensis TaxID=2600579 RepID=A0ABS6KSJ1_9MYCO|nr:DEAD/DEAH box helicase [[Mycobacterium] fortunisiensis]MBU9766612.1 DEAD/DEAH box helicase [[Mycobacterium] fortunisiensis]
MDSADADELIRHADATLARVGKLRAVVADRIHASTDDIVTHALKSTPLEQLRPYLAPGARLGGLANSEYRTVADVHSVPARLLTQVPGVDIGAAQAVQAAAQAMADHLRATTRPQLRDGDTGLLTSLLTLTQADAPVKHLRRLMPRLRSRTASDRVVDSVAELIGQIEEAHHPEGDAWATYRLNPGHVDRMLSEFSSGTTDVDAAQGFVGAEMAAQADQTVLNRSLLHTELRGYQEFGVRYALARERVLLCDDLGLGKTLQALAVAAHLAAEQRRHTVVICQSNTGIHWAAETAKHTALRVVEIRGSRREDRLDEWKSSGGVAIVSYETLQRIKLPERPSLVIVDDAHLLRDPKSDRARAVRNVLTSDNRVLFLSGVPMHPRIGGFRHLADLLQPDVAGKVAPNAGERGSIAFRRAVDRVYLRRDYRDVIDELPMRIATEEWVRPTRTDRERYGQAVTSGNFNAIRQAAWPSGTPTPGAKLDRLVELVHEAHINSARVVVFSHFPAVLDVARKALPGNIFGPLDASVPDQQAVVDAFATDRGPAVLLAHIGAGALDLRRLNAPVVMIIAEPQWRPRTERQVIGRTQRLSELHTVRIHRLLAKGTVDEPIRRLAHDPDQAPPHQDEVVRAEQARLQRARLTAKFSGTD